MQLKLTKKLKNPIIIDGFPGFGMVGTIATEFLIDHLKTEQIGKIVFDEMPAMVAIHEGKLVEPFGIFYNEEHNLVIVHALAGTAGTEWLIADVVLNMAKEFGAKEIISLEGVGSPEETETPRTFFYTNVPNTEKALKKLNVEQLNEGIIMGVTSAILLKADNIPISCIFAETHSNMPDSKAAAKIIEVLDGHLDLNVDFKPLLKMAEQLEGKLKKIMQQSKMAETQKDKKDLDYLG